MDGERRNLQVGETQKKMSCQDMDVKVEEPAFLCYVHIRHLSSSYLYY